MKKDYAELPERKYYCPRCGNELEFGRKVMSGDHVAFCSCGLEGFGGTAHDAWLDLVARNHRRCNPGETTYVNAIPPIRRPGFKYIETLPEGEYCVSMITFKETIYVATTCRVYRLVDETLEPVKFAVEDDKPSEG